MDQSMTSLFNPRRLSVSQDFFRVDSMAIDPEALPASPILRTIQEIDTSTDCAGAINENAYVTMDGSSGKVSLAKSIFNLANTTIGAGTLSLPFFFAQTGYIFGVVLLIIIASLSDVSLHLLVDCGLFAEKRTYLNVARHAKGRFGVRIVEWALLFLTFGAMTSYLVIIGNVANRTILVLTEQNVSVDGTYLTLGAIAVVSPLLFLKNLSSLAPASILAIVTVSWLIGLVTFDSAQYLISGSPSGGVGTLPLENSTAEMMSNGNSSSADGGGADSDYEMFSIGQKIFFAVPTVALAYTNHTNLYEIIAEMERPTKKRISTLIHVTTFMCTVLYATMGVAGYLRFGSDTQDDIILNYSDTSVSPSVPKSRQKLMTSGSIGIVLCLILSFPLLLFPCRNCFHIILRAWMQSNWCPAGARHFDPNVYFVFETLVLVGCAFGLSVVVPNLSTVFGLTGAITGSLLVYILPSWFYLLLTRTNDAKVYFPEQPVWMQRMSRVLILFGLVVFVTGTGSVLYQSFS